MMEGRVPPAYLPLSHAQLLFSSLSYVCSSQHTDMPEEMRVEAMELCVTACEKYATNNEVATTSKEVVLSDSTGFRQWLHPQGIL